MNLQTFRERRSTTIAAMRAITEAASRENRDLTDEEGSRFDEHRSTLTRIERDLERAEALAQAERSAPETRAVNAGPLLDLVSADRLAPYTSGQTPMLRLETRASLRSVLAARALVGDGAAGGTSANEYPVAAQRIPGVWNDPRVATSLVDVVRHVPVNSNTAEYVILEHADNDAGIQDGEGAAKPEAALGYDLATAPVRTYAVTLPISEQLIADAPEAAAHVQSILQYHVIRRLTSEMINGASALVTGIAEAASAYSPTIATFAGDKLGEAAATLRAAGWMADAVLLHPLDWFAIQVETDTSGRYLEGSWRAPADGPLFGLRVVTDPAVTQGTGYVFDRNQIVLFDRQQITAQFGWVNEQFSENLRTLRVEGRFGFAVTAPSAVYSVNIAA